MGAARESFGFRSVFVGQETTRSLDNFRRAAAIRQHRRHPDRAADRVSRNGRKVRRGRTTHIAIMSQNDIKLSRLAAW